MSAEQLTSKINKLLLEARVFTEQELKQAFINYRIKCDYYLSERDDGFITQKEYEEAIEWELKQRVEPLLARERTHARELVEAKIAVTSNAKIYTNKHDASYIVFETEHRDVSQNELTAIYYSELSNLDRINTTIKIPQELTKPESKENV